MAPVALVRVERVRVELVPVELVPVDSPLGLAAPAPVALDREGSREVLVVPVPVAPVPADFREVLPPEDSRARFREEPRVVSRGHSREEPRVVLAVRLPMVPVAFLVPLPREADSLVPSPVDLRMARFRAVPVAGRSPAMVLQELQVPSRAVLRMGRCPPVVPWGGRCHPVVLCPVVLLAVRGPVRPVPVASPVVRVDFREHPPRVVPREMLSRQAVVLEGGLQEECLDRWGRWVAWGAVRCPVAPPQVAWLLPLPPCPRDWECSRSRCAASAARNSLPLSRRETNARTAVSFSASMTPMARRPPVSSISRAPPNGARSSLRSAWSA